MTLKLYVYQKKLTLLECCLTTTFENQSPVIVHRHFLGQNFLESRTDLQVGDFYLLKGSVLSELQSLDAVYGRKEVTVGSRPSIFRNS